MNAAARDSPEHWFENRIMGAAQNQSVDARHGTQIVPRKDFRVFRFGKALFYQVNEHRTGFGPDLQAEGLELPLVYPAGNGAFGADDAYVTGLRDPPSRLHAGIDDSPNGY